MRLLQRQAEGGRIRRSDVDQKAIRIAFEAAKQVSEVFKCARMIGIGGIPPPIEIRGDGEGIQRRAIVELQVGRDVEGPYLAVG